MCSGRVDLAFVLRALSNGADGVFIGGCHLGDCHYSTHGNHHALNMVLLVQKIMAHIGLNPERLRLESVSAGEGIRFAEVANEFGMAVKNLGPLGQGEGLSKKGLKLKLEAVTQLIPYLRVVLNERLSVHFGTVEEYKEFYAGADLDRLFRELIADKLAMSQIMLLLREKPLSTAEISQVLGIVPSEIARHLNFSAKHGLVKYEEDLECFAVV
jgi:coenzyme F420-reducing hydrogenase delta subunit